MDLQANQGAPANRRHAGQSDDSDNLSAIVKAGRVFPEAVAELLVVASMSRSLQCLVVALVLTNAGCSKKPDPVLASFVNAEFSTNRIVLYTSGKYECYGANDDGSLRNRPYESGTFAGGVSNYVVSIEKGVFDSPVMRARKVYRIIKHDGVEYLFDELGNAVKKFEETKAERELRHAWRREGG
jgi:hypothetical protein